MRSGNGGGRLIVGNLTCESDWAPAPARRGLSASAQRAIAVYATLLRVFASPGDKLWLPAAVEGLSAPEYAGLPSPIQLHGRLRGLTAPQVLAWGETSALEPLRTREKFSTAAGGDNDLASCAVHQAVWRLPRSSAEAARRANDRRWALEVAHDLGCALEDACVVETIAAARKWIERGGAAASASESWVLKAPYSAAGRERLRGQGRSLPAALEKSIASLLDRFGALVCEPWMDRVADFGVGALLGSTSCRLFPPHRLAVDGRGGFRGIAIDAGCSVGLEAQEQEQLERVAHGVAARLQTLGYRGPFGLDCWRWRDRQGGVHLHPLGEINARMTFGLVARALLERLVASGMASPTDRLLLRLGKGAELAAREASVASVSRVVRVIPLAVPEDPEREAAWAEIEA